MRHGLILSVVLATLLCGTPASADSVISFDDLTESPDGSFSLDVNITGAEDLFSYDLAAIHDPLHSFEAAGSVFDPFVVSLEPISTSVVGTLINPFPGVSGQALLATLTFQLLSNVDSATVTFTSAVLLGSLGQELTASFANPTITLQRSSSVPEPSTLLLMGVGLVGLAQRRLRRASVGHRRS